MKDEFVNLVNECFKNESSQFIHNASKDHAQVLIEKLIDFAIKKKVDIKIVSGHLTNDFYNLFNEKIATALEAGCKVSVIVLRPLELAKNKFAETVRNHSRGSCKQIADGINAPHFILIGDSAFRLEENHEEAKAIASFKNSHIGDILNNLYKKLDPISVAC